jgi:hypothetical protein
MFIEYEDRAKNYQGIPPGNLRPDEWPALLPIAQKFAGEEQGARFAVLRLWSAPHFYPLMIGLHNRQATGFLDSAERSWEWKFLPKDMPGSEYSIHNCIEKRLKELPEEFVDRVVSRGDLVLVMGVDEEDLLRYCTAVTFVLQTKPWLREVDLWRSFINVDVKFLQELDDFWLD